MDCKITLLAKNTTYRHNALAQHGQSILIECDTEEIQNGVKNPESTHFNSGNKSSGEGKEKVNLNRMC